MRLYKRYRTWWIAYRLRGERIRRSLHTRDESVARGILASMQLARTGKVERAAVDAMLDRIYGTSGNAPRTPLDAVWGAYCEHARAVGMDQVAPATWALRRQRVAALVAWIRRERPLLSDAEDVDGPTAAAYAAHLADAGRCAKTRLVILGDLSTVWTALEHVSPAIRNPWRGLRPRAKDAGRTAFTRDEEARVLASAGELGHDWLPACMIARWTAFRYGDVATLRRSEVDLAAGVIRRTPAKTARHGVEVVIPIAAQLRPVLEELMARPVRDDMDEYLLREHACSCTASTWHRQAVRFSAVLERAGVDPRTHTFHTWRHTLRTRMAEGRVDMATAKEICGHRTDAMSAHYDHDQHLDAKRAALEAAV